MKKLLLILTILLPMIVSAQRTIENPVIGAKGIGTLGLAIEKIVLQNDMTKLYMVYYHGQGGSFNMNGTSRIVANGKELKVISSEGIELNGPYIQKFNNEETHFVLNFPPLDKDVDRFDFIEDYCPQCFMIFDVALTDQAAAEIKAARAANNVPDAVKNYAINIKDNSKSLDREEFTMGTATVKGKIYNFDQRVFRGLLDNMEVSAYINNPFTQDQDEVTAKFAADHSFELKVPLTNKHQTVLLRIQPFFNSYILVSAGKTVEVAFDINEIFSKVDNPDGPRITPYFSGENADINYAFNQPLAENFNNNMVYSDEAQQKIVNLSMPQYKDYIINGFRDYCQQVDAMDITKRAKEFLKIDAKGEAAYCLSMGQYFIERAYRAVNHKDYREPIPEFNVPTMTEDYLNYPQLLGLEDVMMFYSHNYGYNIAGWNMCFSRVYPKYLSSHNEYIELLGKAWKSLPSTEKLSKKEKNLLPAIVNKISLQDTTRTAGERAFQDKYMSAVQKYIDSYLDSKAKIYDENLNKILGSGDGYFKDFIKLQPICSGFGRGTVVTDSVVSEVEKMRIPFYAEYIKAKNAEITAQIEAEKKRGGYYVHKVGDSEGDSLLVELIKDFKGKVVLIDFWNTWCGPCRSAIKQMEPMEKDYQGKDVVFLFVADESSPENEYDGMIVSMKGHHYRLTESQASSLKRKWNFNGIPSYVIIGKDGMVKDFHTGFHGVEYYSQKIEEELKK